MEITLKNITVNERLSDETNCFSASLYVDGKKIGVVSNHGTGGPDNFDGDWEAFNNAETWLKENKPAVTLFDDHTIPMDMELYVGELVEDWRLTRDIKKDLKGKVLFIKPGEPGIQAVSWKGTRTVDERHVNAVAAKYPDATILNALPIDEAKTAYKTAA